MASFNLGSFRLTEMQSAVVYYNTKLHSWNQTRTNNASILASYLDDLPVIRVPHVPCTFVMLVQILLLLVPGAESNILVSTLLILSTLLVILHSQEVVVIYLEKPL